MSDGSTKVGDLSIKLGVDASSIEAEAKAGAAKAAAAADAVTAATPAASSGPSADLGAKSKAKAAQKSLNDSIGAVQGIMGKMFYVGAVAAGFYSLGNVIRERVIAVLESGSDKATKFRESLDFTNVKQSLEQTGAKLQELEAKLGESKSSIFSQALNTALGDSNAQLEEEIKSLRGTAQNLRGADNAAKVREAKKALDEIAKAQEKAGQTESEQATQRYEDTAKQIREIVSKANNDPGAQAAASVALQAAKQRENEELDAIDKKAYEQRAADKLAKEKETSDALIALDQMRQDALKATSGPAQQEELDFQKRLADARKASLVDGGAFNPLLQAELDRTVEAITKAHAKAAKQIEQTYAETFRAIKQQSNSIFGGDAAESMTGLGGLLNFTQTVTNANLGAERITSNGGF